MYQEQFTQETGVYAAISPQTLNNANVKSGGIDMSLFKRAFFVVEIGTVTSTGSITAQLVEDNNANLSAATNLAGSNTSQSGLSTSNKQATFEARADQMTKRYLGIKLTEVNSQNVVVAAVALGIDSIHKPGSANNDATVVASNVVS
jgi:hypothetical protein